MVPSNSSKRSNPLFFPILFLLLVGSSNIFLINRRISIQNGSEQNLVGLRDVALVALIVVGMPSSKKLLELMRLGAIKVCLGVVGLTLAAAVYAILSDRPLSQVANELAGLIAWVLPIIVAANLKTLSSIEQCHRMLVGLGIVVSILSLAEVVLKVPLVTGVTADTVSRVGGINSRSTPSCWPLMIIAYGSLLIGLSARRSNSAIGVLTRAVALLIVTFALLMTQARTLLVGMVACLLGAMLIARTRRTRILLLGVGLAMPLTLTVTAAIGTAVLTPQFADSYTRRYAVLMGIDAINEYAPQDGRVAEIRSGLDHWSEWLWVGKGLAASYRDQMYTDERHGGGQMAHNILLYFGTRFGVLGMALFLLFGGAICSLLYRASHSPRPYNAVALCLGVDLVSLLVTSMFGNVFAMPYMAQVAMVAFGCLVAWGVWNAQFKGRAFVRRRGTTQSHSGVLPMNL
jgi:hypothetical protein